MIKLTFLGSGCWQGIPAPFGDDEISQKVEWDSKDFRFRTSAHIQTEHGKNIIVEATPDIRLQSWKFKLGKPDAFLISHWHYDHLFGLMELDWYTEKNKLTVYGNSITKEWYDSRMSHINVDFQVFESYKPFEIDNVRITPITINHVEDTDGFFFEDMTTNKKIAYLSDLRGIPIKTAELVKDSDAIITDATYLESDISDDPTHLQKEQIIPFLRKLSAKEIILTNIGSYQDLTHADLEQKFPQYTIAFDGMKREY
ncbi:MAG: MBL fold metallo-hydrolase [Candidatus Andersenbacteria bacterium]|nr:MBL fold metallo-hydrolase [Candidatus Andersenbacteria bacterium]